MAGLVHGPLRRAGLRLQRNIVTPAATIARQPTIAASASCRLVRPRGVAWSASALSWTNVAILPMSAPCDGSAASGRAAWMDCVRSSLLLLRASSRSRSSAWCDRSLCEISAASSRVCTSPPRSVTEGCGARSSACCRFCFAAAAACRSMTATLCAESPEESGSLPFGNGMIEADLSEARSLISLILAPHANPLAVRGAANPSVPRADLVRRAANGCGKAVKSMWITGRMIWG